VVASTTASEEEDATAATEDTIGGSDIPARRYGAMIG
jgi:hypothetical protein